MSVADEILRLQQAKSDLATSIENKGVTVPAATTLDGYAALVDQIQTGSTLPYDAEVEYLQSSGTQYINTGIRSSNNVFIKLYVYDYFNSSHLGFWVFGGRNGYNNKQIGLFINTNTSNVIFPYNTSQVVLNSYSSYQTSCWIQIGGGTLKIGSTTHSYTQAFFSGDYNIYLFGLNNAGSAVLSLQKIGKVYISSGFTTLDLIPVRVGQVGYMYDKISGQLFGNSGTGSFILGSDKN